MRLIFVEPFELEGDSLVRVQVQGGYWDAEGKTHGYTGDWQGNVRALRAANGTLEQRTDYYPYGAPSQSDNPAVSPYKYSGKRLETRYALNLSHHGARLLLHDIASFAQPDPLAELNYSNPYLYCSADPINRTDPTGLYETKEEAIQDAKARYKGQTVKVIQDKESRYWYIEYATKDGKEKDFGPYDPYLLSSNDFMNLINAFGIGNDAKLNLMKYADKSLENSKYYKGFKFMGFLGAVGSSIASGITMWKAANYQCEDKFLYVKCGWEIGLNIASMFDSRGIVLGVNIVYTIVDGSTGVFSVSYRVSKPLSINNR